MPKTSIFWALLGVVAVFLPFVSTCTCPDDKEALETNYVTSYCGSQISQNDCKPNGLYNCKDTKPGEPAIFVKDCDPCQVSYNSDPEDDSTQPLSFWGTCHPLPGEKKLVLHIDDIVENSTLSDLENADNNVALGNGTILLDEDDNIDTPGEGFFTTKLGWNFSQSTMASEEVMEIDNREIE